MSDEIDYAFQNDTRNKNRFRSKVKGTCSCCANYKAAWLYPVGHDFGTSIVCAYCAKHTYNTRPGFTRDGIILSKDAKEYSYFQKSTWR